MSDNIDPALGDSEETRQQPEQMPTQHRSYGGWPFADTGPRENMFEQTTQLPIQYEVHGEQIYYQIRQHEDIYPESGQGPVPDRAYIDQSLTGTRQPEGVSSPPDQAPPHDIGKFPMVFYRMSPSIVANPNVVKESDDPVYVDAQGVSRSAHLNNVLFATPMVTYGSTGAGVEYVPYEHRLEPEGLRIHKPAQQPNKHPYKPQYQEAHMEAYANMYGKPFEQRNKKSSQGPESQSPQQQAQQGDQQPSHEAYQDFSKQPEQKDSPQSAEQSSQNLSDNVSAPMSLASDDEGQDSMENKITVSKAAPASAPAPSPSPKPKTTMCPNCMKMLPSRYYRERFWGPSKHCNECVDEWERKDKFGKVCKMCLYWKAGRNYETPKGNGMHLMACSRCRQEMAQTGKRITKEAQGRMDVRLERYLSVVRDNYNERKAYKRYLLRKANDAEREIMRKDKAMRKAAAESRAP